MTIETCVKLLMKSRGVTQETMGKMLGLKSSSGVRMRLANGNMTIHTVLEMIDLLGFELVLRESTTGRRRDDEIIITREDEI